MSTYNCPLCRDKGWVRFTRTADKRVVSYPVICPCQLQAGIAPVEPQRVLEQRTVVDADPDEGPPIDTRQ